MSTLLVPDWNTRLSQLIVSRMHTPFNWGVHDCALWAAEGRCAVTGQDDAAEYRGTYTSAIGAVRRLLTVDGVRTPLEIADKKWGPRKPISLVHTGFPVAADLVKLGIHDPNELSLGLSLGVCNGRYSLFVGVEDDKPGLINVPTQLMEHGYG